MITDAKAEKYGTFIAENAGAMGVAQSQYNHLKEFLKVKRSELRQKMGGGTVQDKDDFAYTHPEYIECLEGLKVAEQEFVTLRYQIEAAKENIEIWRTHSANSRALR